MNISAIAVIVPARDEEETIASCLRSIKQAARRLTHIEVFIVVVDDGSRDRTASTALAELGRGTGLVLSANFRNVGEARRMGCSAALARFKDRRADHVWLAFTDADSHVELDWLERQAFWGRLGKDGVAGIVRLSEAAAGKHVAYQSIYARRIFATHHEHIHGANLGVRASAYLAVGGFPCIGLSEDVRLWHNLSASGARMLSDPQLVVETSDREIGRIEGGHATFLRKLQTDAVAAQL